MGKDGEKTPKGGRDKTPLKTTSPPTYIVKITFHSASNIPVSDYPALTSDPYILAQLDTDLPTRHKEDPKLRFRTHTIHRTIEPEWESSWVVAGVPSSGFNLSARIYDEDPGNHDDLLGKVIHNTGRIGDNWDGVKRQEFKVKKAGADLITYGLRWGKTLICRNSNLHARMTISIELLGKTEEEMGKVYTLNNFWWVHYSPVVGRLAGVKADDDDGVERYDFQANELQLRGPVPNELYHRYVEFKPFVAGMFTASGIRGRILHRVLHHQHERLYNFDKKTKFGAIEYDHKAKVSDDLALQFLDMVHYDQGGRLFTYVITLDGMFRFTETGKEFGIDLLSKHTMHSDVNIYIAFSGEFLVRRLAKPHQKAESLTQHTHPAEDVTGGPPKSSPPKDPKYYELVIDNDSGTYRPDASLFPIFKKYLKLNFPNLHIVTKGCDDEGLEKIKEDQKKTKEQEGDGLVFGQGSDSGSISSSDEDELEERAREDEYVQTGAEKAFDAVDHPSRRMKEVFSKNGDGKGEELGDQEKKA